jgi:hypothetical protein
LRLLEKTLQVLDEEQQLHRWTMVDHGGPGKSGENMGKPGAKQSKSHGLKHIPTMIEAY